jgi:tetratricopeptide (TPR) repeat protein
MEVLRRLGRAQDAVTVADAALARLARAGGDVTVEVPIRYERALALSAAGEKTKALQEYHRVIALGRDHDDEDVRLYTADALGMKGALLLDAGRYEESVAANDETLRYVTDSDSPEWRLHAARALVPQAMALGALGRWTEAQERAAEALQRLEDVDLPPRSCGVTAEALYQQARAYRELGCASQVA